MEHWNRTESPEINPHVHGQLTYNKDAKTRHCRENHSLNKQMVLGQLVSHMWNNDIRPLSDIIYKNLKWIKLLNVRF